MTTPAKTVRSPHRKHHLVWEVKWRCRGGCAAFFGSPITYCLRLLLLLAGCLAIITLKQHRAETRHHDRLHDGRRPVEREARLYLLLGAGGHAFAALCRQQALAVPKAARLQPSQCYRAASHYLPALQLVAAPP